MYGKWKENSTLNGNMFNINGRPMKFYLEGYDEVEFHEYSKIIEAYGGEVSRPDSGTIIFSEPGRYVDTHQRKFHIDCLRDSVALNNLQDINKYALPWNINRENSKAKNDRISNSSIPETLNKFSDFSTSQPHVVIQDCLMAHPVFMKEKKNVRKNVPEREQSTIVSSSHNSVNIPLTETKLNKKASPIATDTTNSMRKLAEGIIPPVKSLKKKSKCKSYDLRSSILQDDDAPEIITEVKKKSVIIAEITLTSDEESAEAPIFKETSGKELKKDKIDLANVDYDAPIMYAVWSRAGPPGPPLSDSDDDDKSKVMKFMKGEEEENKRKKLRNLKYIDWDSCSSEESHKKKGKRRRRSRKSTYEYDPNFEVSK